MFCPLLSRNPTPTGASKGRSGHGTRPGQGFGHGRTTTNPCVCLCVCLCVVSDVHCLKSVCPFVYPFVESGTGAPPPQPVAAQCHTAVRAGGGEQQANLFVRSICEANVRKFADDGPLQPTACSCMLLARTKQNGHTHNRSVLLVLQLKDLGPHMTQCHSSLIGPTVQHH